MRFLPTTRGGKLLPETSFEKEWLAQYINADRAVIVHSGIAITDVSSLEITFKKRAET